jgi:hypothetical protein
MHETMNLDLQVQGSKQTGYRVEAIGPGEERTSGAFDWLQVADLPAELGAISDGSATRDTLKRAGTSLFKALFPRNVLRLYDRTRPEPGQERRLRIRLHLPSELASLPWELLYDQDRYLSFDPRCPIVRFLDLPDAPPALSTEPPLRLLHLIANPADTVALDVEKEAALLNRALAGLAAQRLVEVIPGRPGTLETLRRGVRQECHVLHFSGHGEVADDEGTLFFEDESGYHEPVDRETLAHLFQGSQVRLAVLNACKSALATDRDAFASVAAALVRAGLPAVIAHQYPVPDRSAIAFAAEFYRALADGLPVDAAVCEGRKAILSELGPARWERVDWATPVLFMRSPDGHILNWQDRTGDPGGTGRLPIQNTTTVKVDTINGGIVNIGTIGGAVSSSLGPGADWLLGNANPVVASIPRNGDRLPALLGELGQKIRVLAPREKQPLAREQVASIERAVTGERLDPAALARAWRWFRRELPALSGATLSVIREARPLVEQAGDTALDEYLLLFGEL